MSNTELPTGTGIICCVCKQEIGYGEMYQTGALGTFHSLGCSPPGDAIKFPNWCAKAGEDPINHPAHYTMGKIEVIDFIEDKKLPYHLGNVVKYLCRAAHKGKELEDLKKAAWYLDRYIKQRSA